MKKLNLWLFASLFVAAFTLTACGDDDSNDPAPTPSSSISKSDLIGKWTLKRESGISTYEFTDSKLGFGDGEAMIPYTFENGVLKYVDGENNLELNVSMLYEKNVLVLKHTEKNGEDKEYTEVDFAFRDGKTIPAKLEDIQGTWHWYMYGNTDYIRCAMTIKNNNFELIVVPWSMRYVGTFAYENGYMKCTVTKCYSARSSNSEGFGEGTLDPKTATATQWWELDEGDWLYEPLMNMAFVGNGTEAYGVFANLAGLYVKK